MRTVLLESRKNGSDSDEKSFNQMWKTFAALFLEDMELKPATEEARHTMADKEPGDCSD